MNHCSQEAGIRRSPLIEILGSGTEAIAPELLAIAATIAINTGQNEDYEALGFDFSRNWETRRPHNYGDVVSFLNEDGTVWQSKVQFPKPDSRGYLAQKGGGSRGYLPGVTLSIWQTIADRHGVALPDWVALEITLGNGASKSEGLWAWVEAHPQIPIVVTEGGKKSLAALSLGYVAIALYGVNSGVSKFETIGGERLRKLTPSLIPDLQRFAVPGRRWVLAFDADEAAKTQSKVRAALADLSWHLEQTGGSVAIALWQSTQGKGLDDLIVQSGAAAWEEAYQAAIPAIQWRIQRELTRAVRRSPDLNIGDREFSEFTDELPLTGLVVLHGGKGTGKSKAIGAMLRSWLSFTPLISLGRSQAESWGGVFINDGDLVGNRLLKDGSPVAGGSVCLPSILKVEGIPAEVLILDETTAVLESLLNSTLCNKGGIRPLLIAEHDRRVRAAELVILADADLTEETIAHYEAITGNRAFYVRSERQALPYDCEVLEGTQNQAIASLAQRIEALPQDKIIYLNTDSKRLAESTSEMLAGVRVRSLLITSDTSGGDLEKAFLNSQGALIPELIGRGVRIVISSPTIAQGFSIECHTDRIDSVWGIYTGGSIPAHSIAQSLDRVRSSEVPRFIRVPKRGSAYSKLSKAETITAFTREFKQLNTTSARLARLSLSPETATAVDRIDWDSNNLRMLAALEVRRNRGMGNLRDTVIAILRSEGKKITHTKSAISKAVAAAAGQAMAAAAAAIKTAHAVAVAAAADISAVEADRLASKSEARTPEEALALEKYWLAQFYKASVDADLVLFDRDRATQREIENLEHLLNDSVAINRTASTINQNSKTPQDWSRAAVRSWLYQQSGFSEFVREIIAGDVVEIQADRTAAIVAFVRSHREEFRMVFGFGASSDLSDQQILGQLLSSVGIRTKRHRRKGIYSVQIERLAVILEIIDRRKKADPPPLVDLNQGGGSAQTSLPSGWTGRDIIALREAVAECPELLLGLRKTIPPEILKMVA
jgi:Domain of unknown function (DUF3854)